MNKLFEYALKTKAVEHERLINILEELSKKGVVDIEHILEYILGFKNIPEDVNLNSYHRGDKNSLAYFKKYDILNNLVTYTYLDKNEIWFRTQEEADAYTHGTRKWPEGDYKYSKRDGYEFSGEQYYESDSTCTLEEWEEWNR